MRTQQVTFHMQRSPEEIAIAITFARTQAFHWYRCEPSDMPEHIFAARIGTQVVATVGVTEWYLGQPLSLQHIYNLESAKLPQDWHWTQVVQLSWFFSNLKGCFMTLLLIVLNHCYHSGKRFAILQMKDVVSSMLKEKGLKLLTIPFTQLYMNKISETARAYYQNESPVQLYSLDIIENMYSIKNHVLVNQSCHMPRQCNDLYYDLCEKSSL